MKTDDFNDTMRNEGDDAARDHFDNQRKRYHHAEDPALKGHAAVPGWQPGTLNYPATLAPPPNRGSSRK